MKITARMFAFFIICICLFSLLHKTTLAATYTAASCENKPGQTDVQNAVNAASSGDTVIVPSGSATWTSTVTITKGIALQGAGVGKTVIINGMASTTDYLIVYRPAVPSLDEAFEITGFTFQINQVSQGVFLNNTDSNTELTKIRIHQNSFTGGRPYTGKPIIRIGGQICGLIDHNTFSSEGGIFQNIGGGIGPWENVSASFGNAKALYIENNVITLKDVLTDGARGARYVVRYNTITNNSSGSLLLFDAHGNQLGGLTATMQTEIYGNHITDAGNRLVLILDQRGGMTMTFYNYATTTASRTGVSVRDEYDDIISPPATSPNGQPQHVSNSYIWSNYDAAGLMPTKFAYFDGTATGAGDNYIDDSSATFCGSGSNCPCSLGSCETTAYGVEVTGGTGVGQYRVVSFFTQTRITVTENWDTNPDATSTYEVRLDCCNNIKENREFWTMRSTSVFDGTGGVNAGGGVGCGTLAEMNAITPTSVGVGFWATNQSCSDFSGLIGANPTTPISGTLYRWSGVAWVPYYTPYAYPHPLGKLDAPKNVHIIEQ